MFWDNFFCTGEDKGEKRGGERGLCKAYKAYITMTQLCSLFTQWWYFNDYTFGMKWGPIEGSPETPHYDSAVMVSGASVRPSIGCPWCRETPGSLTATRQIAVVFPVWILAWLELLQVCSWNLYNIHCSCFSALIVW